MRRRPLTQAQHQSEMVLNSCQNIGLFFGKSRATIGNTGTVKTVVTAKYQMFSSSDHGRGMRIRLRVRLINMKQAAASARRLWLYHDCMRVQR